MLLFAIPASIVRAEIQKISSGGVDLTLSDYVPEEEEAVVVFHTPWDQTSITLLEEITTWAESHPDLHILFVDAVDERTQVYRQHNLVKIPTVVVFDKDHKLYGRTFDNVEDLEKFLEDEDLL